MFVSTKFLRHLFWTVLVAYAVVVLVVLGMRYVVLPRIDTWRPQIEQQVGKALGAQARIGGLEADWSGLHPRLRLSDVRIVEPGKPAPVLQLPRVSAVFSWSSVLRLNPRFLDLRVEGAELDVRRDAQGLLWVAGMSFDPDAGGERGDGDFLGWLSRQRQIGLYGATVRWRDELRQSPELVLSNVDALLRNGALAHRVSLRANPPAALAARVEVRGEIEHRLFARAGRQWTGQVYAQIDDAEPAAWAPWLDVPAVQGRLAARGWARLDDGQVRDVTLDTVLRGLRWTTADGAAGISVDQVRARVEGAPGDVLPRAGLLPGTDLSMRGLRVEGEASGVRAALPSVFETPAFDVDSVALDARVRHLPNEPMVLDLAQLHASNADLDLRVSGAWRGEGGTPAGTADLRGILSRGEASAIHRYFPRVVNAYARNWLRHGLVAGRIRDTAITLKGDLADFPFTSPGVQGEFRVSGAFDDATVDYAPARPDRQGWPRLQGLSGDLALDKLRLDVSTQGGRIEAGPGETLQLGALRAVIPDMEHNATLDLEGESSGAVSAYLALARNSPLGRMLRGALSEADGAGTWRVPLALHIPLMHAEDSTVDGRIVFQGNQFRFMPEMPYLGKVSGELAFSETGVRTEGMQGVFLGGAARLSGRLDGEGQSLRFAGTLPASGLRELGDSPVLPRLSGKTPYEGSLSYARGGGLVIEARTPLTGLGVDLPEPLGKAVGATRPLQLRWGPAADAGKGDIRRWLSADLGTDVHMVLERDSSDKAATYFSRGALGLGQAAALPLHGMRIAGKLPALDLDAWDALPRPDEGQDGSGASLAPPLREVDLDVGTLAVAGHQFDAVGLQVRRPEPSQWRVALNAPQAEGTLEWTEASGAVAGKVVGRFSRLALGSQDSDPGESAAAAAREAGEGGLSDIPAVDLQVQALTVYGRPLGRLDLQGVNLERGRLWRLDRLDLGNEAASLQATGTWRLDGEQRGLSLDAGIDFKDLGRFLDDLGHRQLVAGGSGAVKTQLVWRDFPWQRDLAKIQGDAEVSLDKGRFVHVNSRSARLLELLSLQSVQRLSKLEFNPADAFTEGFPFDTVRGRLKLSQGVASTDGYKVSGPVATIVLGGTTDILAQQWNMRAVVVPNLDASGAAVVTALAVNPLIGLGAFLTQWLLQAPLARAMTAEYQVTGSWDDPKVETAESQVPAEERMRSRERVEP